MSGSTETAVEKPGVQVFVIFKYIEIELLEPFFCTSVQTPLVFSRIRKCTRALF